MSSFHFETHAANWTWIGDVLGVKPNPFYPSTVRLPPHTPAPLAQRPLPSPKLTQLPKKKKNQTWFKMLNVDDKCIFMCDMGIPNLLSPSSPDSSKTQQETCVLRYYHAYNLQPPCFSTAASWPPCFSPSVIYMIPALVFLSRSWSCQSTGPILHRLECVGTSQTCWPSWVIVTSFVPRHVTWLSICWTCSWITMMLLSSSCMSSPSPACF